MAGGSVMLMRRRSFLALSAAAATGSALRRVSAQTLTKPTGEPDKEELEALLGKLLVTDSLELQQFAVEAYRTCVLGKIKAPAAPLAHAWLVPGGGYYAQWVWDTTFVADLLSLLPGQEELLRGVFENYWEFQKRWNDAKPAIMHDMVANFIAPFGAMGARDGTTWLEFPGYSQAPLLAWGMERVYKRNGDKQMLLEGLQPLENFHEWYWRERDITNIGLIGVGAYSGDTQHARYETYDREVDLDDLQMISHPGRPAGVENGQWYGDIAIPANTAYLLLSEQSLERLAVIMGDDAMAKRRRARYEKGSAAMKKHMWDKSAKCFLAVNINTMKKSNVATVGSFMPLLAHVPTEKQAKAMASALASNAWATALPIPTVARTDGRYSSGEFWRGDVWPAPNYQVATGLAGYGLRDAAARIADATVANALKVGISERYDSASGTALGVPGLGMSASMLTMMLDGLTSDRYRLRVR